MPRPSSNWRSLLDADDLPPPRSKPPSKQRTVAEALAFHRAQSRREAQEQWTLARLTGVDVGPAAAYADERQALVPMVAALEVPRPVPAPAARRIPGPPPPKSWTSPLPSSAAASVSGKAPLSAPGKDAHRLPLEVDQFTRSHLGSFVDLHPSLLVPRRPPRLLVTALLLLLRRLDASTNNATAGDAAAEQAREDVASLPRHLRELALWGVPNWAGRGISAREVEALLWDVRDWGSDDDDNDVGEQNGSIPRSADALPDDDWDATSSTSGSSRASAVSTEGWQTLYLPASPVPLSTLRLLLAPLPSTGLPTPVTHLSLAHSPWPLERLLAVLPAHLRALSLEGVRLAPAETNGLVTEFSSTASEARVKSVLVRLARATPLLQYIDLSFTRPPLSLALLQASDGIPWRTQWRALTTLVVKGLEGTDGLRARVAEREVRRAVGAGGSGRGWLDVVVE